MSIRILTVFLFGFLILFGLWMAAHRPLWNDEYYSLTSSTLGSSYGQILAGGINEGNNSPLFYFFQKLQCDVFAYHPPQAWVRGKWEGVEIFSQIFLRIQPVLWIALAIAALFYYFSSVYSVWLGMYAVVVTLSSMVLFEHWTEARPYAAWFALSIFQLIILLECLKENKATEEKRYWMLAAVHLLLALTVSISMVQIIAVSLLMFRAKVSWKYWIVMLVLPMAVDVFYYLQAPHYNFYFIDGPVSLISANFPKERFLIAGIFTGVFLWLSYNRQDKQGAIEMKYLGLMGLMLAFFAVVLWKLKMGAHQPGFQIANRYFLSLAPLSIIGTIIFSEYLFSIKNKGVQIGASIILVALLIGRLYAVFHHGIPFISV